MNVYDTNLPLPGSDFSCDGVILIRHVSDLRFEDNFRLYASGRYFYFVKSVRRDNWHWVAIEDTVARLSSLIDKPRILLDNYQINALRWSIHARPGISTDGYFEFKDLV